MRFEMPLRLSRRPMRCFDGLAAPRAAALTCVFLTGMTGIAAGALLLRPETAPPPRAAADLRLTLPAAAVTAHLPRLPAMSAPRPARPAADAPVLAALSPPPATSPRDLASPVSRIYLGRPAAVPPARPARLTADDPARGLQASLRPQPRHAGLARADAASTEAEEALADAGEAADSGDMSGRWSAPGNVRNAGRCPARLARAMPRRRGTAPEGRAFMARLDGMNGTDRDHRVTRQILTGNMPRFLRQLAPVRFSGRTPDGRRARITLCVTPDYLALGSDRDFVRVPLGLRAATRIGERFDMLLPTAQMVDLIYQAARLRLTPQPMQPGPQMTSTAYLLHHNATIEAQRRRRGAPAETLISGHKKDLVLTNRLTERRGRVAIYGWHRRNGRPIQPLSTVHGAGYADYSHGVRLVSRIAYLDGKPVDLRQLLADARYAGLLSNEGPIRGPRLLMAALAGN